MAKAESEKATTVVQVKEESERKVVQEIPVEKEKQEPTKETIIEEKVEPISAEKSEPITKTKSPEEESRVKESCNALLHF